MLGARKLIFLQLWYLPCTWLSYELTFLGSSLSEGFSLSSLESESDIDIKHETCKNIFVQLRVQQVDEYLGRIICNDLENSNLEKASTILWVTFMSFFSWQRDVLRIVAGMSQGCLDSKVKHKSSESSARGSSDMRHVSLCTSAFKTFSIRRQWLSMQYGIIFAFSESTPYHVMFSM